MATGSQRVMAEEIFEAMLDGAIDDLRQSGLEHQELFAIVERQFGARYANLFCTVKETEA